MKKTICFLFFLNCFIWVFAQDETTPDLLHQYSQEKNGAIKDSLTIEIAYSYLYSKPDNALYWAKMGAENAKEKHIPRWEAACMNTIGIIFWTMGNYPQALDALFGALRINEENNFQIGMVKNYANIGLIYSEHGEERQALEYAFKAKELSEKIHYDIGLTSSLLNIGDSYDKFNQLDSARMFTQQAYEMALSFKDTNNIGHALNNLGNIHFKMQQIMLAMEYFRLSIPFLEKANDDDFICEVKLGMAKIFYQGKKMDSAIYYSRQSMEEAKVSGNTKRILDASIFLSALYKNKKIIDSAFVYQELVMAVKDSLYSQDKVKEVQNLSFNEKIRQQEVVEMKTKAEEDRKNNLQMMGIAAFIIVFFISLVPLSQKKIKPNVIEFFGVMGLLFVFEFISIFIHPYIGAFTHHTPVFMLIISVCIAAILVPAHHKLEHWVKKKLVLKTNHHPKKIK